MDNVGKDRAPITKGAKMRKCTLVAGLKGFTAALFMEEQEQTFITKSVEEVVYFIKQDQKCNKKYAKKALETNQTQL